MTDLELRSALDDLLVAWTAVGVPVADHHAAGLPEDQASRMLPNAVGQAPNELVTWFGWHNGHDYPRGTPRWRTSSGIDSFDLMTFDECLQELSVNREVASEEGEWGREWWRDAYFPLLRGRGGDSVVAIVSGSSDTCCVKYWHPEFHDCEPAADSIAALVRRWTDRIRAGDWVWRVHHGSGAWQVRDGLDRYRPADL